MLKFLLVKILFMSISASLCGAVVLGAARAGGRLFSKRTIYALWTAVIVLSLVPISLSDFNAIRNGGAVGNLSEYRTAGNFGLSALKNIGTNTAKNTAAGSAGVNVAEKSGAKTDSDGKIIGKSGNKNNSENTKKTTADSSETAASGAAKARSVKGADNGNTAENTAAGADNNTAANTALSEAGAANSKTTANTGKRYIDLILNIISVMYLLTVAALGGVWIFRRVKFNAVFRRCCKREDESRLEGVKLRVGVRSNAALYTVAASCSPFVFGVIRPKIVIPESGADDGALMHELVHIKHRDTFRLALINIAKAIHFFNPLCYVAFRLMNKDMEMSCDEKVIESFKSIKREYSTALLGFATNNYKASPSPLCFIENDAKSRIKNILKFKKPKKAVSIIAIILCLTVLSACVSNPVDVKKQTDKISINTNISSTQSSNFSDDYILGKVIFASPILSSILIDGGNTTIKFDGKKLIRSNDAEQTEYSDKVEELEYTKKQFSEKYSNKDDALTPVIDKKYFKNAKLIKEVKYYNDESFVSIIYFDNKPALYGSDGIRIYEIMPNSNGFGKAVSNEILKHTSPNFDYEKYKSEAHYIYQKEYTGDDTISVYLNFYAATYSTRFGYVKDESAWMSDAKIDLKLNDNFDYSVVKFTVPQDGSEYNKSIKEMFSNDVYAYYFGDNANNNDSISKELTIQAIKSLVKSNKDIDINKSIETLIKRIGNINLIDNDYNEYFNLLVDYGEYTVRYTFNKYKNGKLGEPEGKILQSAFSKIAEDEYVKASANTGKEYFDAFDKHARDLKKQNKLDYDFKLLYPYTYLYLTEYAK